MNKLLLTIIFFLISATSLMAQHGFTIEYVGGGSLHTIDLNNANKTYVGATMNNFGAGDFGPNDELYGINSGTNELYLIDTINGATTLIGSVPPPSNHLWTGMAYDESSQIMYAYSSEGTASGTASLHIIDITDASLTLVGTQTTATAIGCIAIDGSGQMYGMQMSALSDLYMIDKTDGSVTYVGEIGQGAAGMGHGMDWCNADQTMYLTTYNSATFENTLRTVNLTTGATTQVGGLLGMWTGVIAIPGAEPLSAGFTSDITDVCAGGQVNFTDQSTGDVTSWSWTFEGGTPSTSSDQNPTVTYNSTGTFDVTLEVGDGTGTSTVTNSDMIVVTDIPSQPDEPTGDTEACGGDEVVYNTNDVPDADNYTWEVTPLDAGTLVENGTSATLTTSNAWSGDYTIKVQASNSCGAGNWSTELSCSLYHSPEPYFLGGGGSFCEGGQGLELTLDNSEVDVDYELYLDNVPMGNIVAGTGSAISFGYQTDEGVYSVTGFTSSCTSAMYGEAIITIDELPGQAYQPEGNNMVCAGAVETYQTQALPGANVFNWILEPSEAGIITGTGGSIDVEWSETYSGSAFLSVYGSNDCGDGETSEELEVTVNEYPEPAVSGETEACLDESYLYSTTDVAGNTYTWTVSGGEITTGAGTSEVEIKWTEVGNGTVSVIETNPTGCDGISEELQIVVDECTSILEDRINHIEVYPNPASTFVNMNFADEQIGNATVMIYDMAGNLQLSKTLTENIIDIRTIPVGSYLIKISTKEVEIYSGRLEVVR